MVTLVAVDFLDLGVALSGTIICSGDLLPDAIDGWFRVFDFIVDCLGEEVFEC